MKSWKENNILLKIKESNENKGVPFNWIVNIDEGKLRTFKLNSDKSSESSFINKGIAKAIEKAIGEENEIVQAPGLAKYVDDKYAPYISSITFREIKEGEIRWKSSSYTFKPIFRFDVIGTLPKNTDIQDFKSYVCDYIEGQCSDGWGEGFEQKALPAKERHNKWGETIYPTQSRYFSPWSPESEVWISSTK